MSFFSGFPFLFFTFTFSFMCFNIYFTFFLLSSCIMFLYFKDNIFRFFLSIFFLFLLFLMLALTSSLLHFLSFPLLGIFSLFFSFVFSLFFYEFVAFCFSEISINITAGFVFLSKFYNHFIPVISLFLNITEAYFCYYHLYSILLSPSLSLPLIISL